MAFNLQYMTCFLKRYVCNLFKEPKQLIKLIMFAQTCSFQQTILIVKIKINKSPLYKNIMTVTNYFLCTFTQNLIFFKKTIFSVSLLTFILSLYATTYSSQTQFKDVFFFVRRRHIACDWILINREDDNKTMVIKKNQQFQFVFVV